MIKILTLVENTSTSIRYKSRHGLSLYVETEDHKLLFDVGPDDTFISNAEKMNVDLSEVDTVVISHAHFDHCGGMDDFLKVNSKAKIYIHKSAAGKECYSKYVIPVNIGIKGSWINSDRVVFVGDEYRLDDDMILFSNVEHRRLFPEINGTLLMRNGNGELVPDDFEHEQYLYIQNNGKKYLFSGCSHAGIVNIVDTFDVKYCDDVLTPVVVIGGFHLYDVGKNTYEPEGNIIEIMKALKETRYKYLTCHCTGRNAYKMMKKSMGSALKHISVGSVEEYE